MNVKYFLILLMAVSSAGTVAAQAEHDHSLHAAPTEQDRSNHAEQMVQHWTCSMHPAIKLDKPGRCPICGMDLVPVSGGASGGDGVAAAVELSETAERLMDVATTAVARKMVERPVRLSGKIDYDETRVKHITAWVPGRIERLFVDYTGIEVRKNDHMVSMYSPELLSAQEELIQASRSLQRIKGGSEIVQRSTRRALDAARQKLSLLGLTAQQITQIEKRGTVEDFVTIYAPMGGTVVEKNVSQGTYVQTGTRIYTIADLSHLWLNLDAYESDLPWITYGQKVTFKAEALPGETFDGVVSFVQPILNEKTRTVTVRVNVDNSKERLKPGMFVTAYIKSRLDSAGRVVSASYEGKWVCPMHPEVLKGGQGECPICGMQLVQAETLPFIQGSKGATGVAPLVIPASAPLLTGTRALVYVREPDRSRFHLREVVLGPRAGDYYIVQSGLHEGELVVSKGAFKLDADLQIRGEQSMMNPDGGVAAGAHQH